MKSCFGKRFSCMEFPLILSLASLECCCRYFDKSMDRGMFGAIQLILPHICCSFKPSSCFTVLGEGREDCLGVVSNSALIFPVTRVVSGTLSQWFYGDQVRVVFSLKVFVFVLRIAYLAMIYKRQWQPAQFSQHCHQSWWDFQNLWKWAADTISASLALLICCLQKKMSCFQGWKSLEGIIWWVPISVIVYGVYLLCICFAFIFLL